MSAYWVVKHLDVIEDIGGNGGTIGVDPAPDSLLFQQAEEALRDGVVVTVAALTHARHHAVSLQERLPVIACVLTPLIRMDENAWLGFSSPYRRQEGLKR